MLAPSSSMEFESEILLTGNPDSGKKQHALELRRIIGKPTAKAVDREELRLAA